MTDGAPQPAGDIGPPARTPVHPRRYRDVVGRFPTGVTIVTAHLGGQHHGMTVSSFTSVSLEPVLVLISIERAARLHEIITAAGAWGVSVLAADQEDISRRFARRGRPIGDGLRTLPHRLGPVTGAILLTEALATLECRTVARYPGGDHTLLLGEVLAAETPRPDAPPLLYHRGDYRGVGPDPRR
jgi:flavin reductase (DIM6/NTAB) family NADH-FMN oxidoreductase RutF